MSMHIQDIYTFSRLWPQGIFRLYAVGCFQHSLASFPLFTQLVIIFTWFLDWLQGGSRLSVCVAMCVSVCVFWPFKGARFVFPTLTHLKSEKCWERKCHENSNATCHLMNMPSDGWLNSVPSKFSAMPWPSQHALSLSFCLCLCLSFVFIWRD